MDIEFTLSGSDYWPYKDLFSEEKDAGFVGYVAHWDINGVSLAYCWQDRETILLIWGGAFPE